MFKAQNNLHRSISRNDDSLKQFFGTIGDIPVEIFLKKHDNNIEGYLNYIYYYQFPDFLSPPNPVCRPPGDRIAQGPIREERRVPIV